MQNRRDPRLRDPLPRPRLADDAARRECHHFLRVDSIINIFGIEHIIGQYLGFIKVNLPFLQDKLFASLPKERFVFAVNDTALTDLPEGNELLEAIDYIKIDTIALTPQACERLFEQCRRHDIKVIASKVENHAVYDAFYELEADFFQGYYLRKPKLFENATIKASEAAILKLWNLIQEDTATDTIVEAFAEQHALAVQLL